MLQSQAGALLIIGWDELHASLQCTLDFPERASGTGERTT